ncbi:MarR family transcriptional regulator [Dactylosporangium sp. NPDC051484]|uniref:MarR family winged helix-turn-helix transcriptional regulator n=1 Tax=Dactylosporangium sp. NPDC051484 TaxID=3154942 RepID=UPI00344D45BC
MATELMKAMTRLRARLRIESAPIGRSWTWSQLTTLTRIIEHGASSITDLAQAEHMRRQSMTETIAAMEEGGLVRSERDPGDGRKRLIVATADGERLARQIPEARLAWLTAVFDEVLDVDEVDTILRAVRIISRIADIEGATCVRALDAVRRRGVPGREIANTDVDNKK